MFAIPKAASGLYFCQARSKAESCGLYASLYRIAITNWALTPAC